MERAHRLYAEILGAPGERHEGGVAAGDGGVPTRGALAKPTAIKLHQTIKKVGEDLSGFGYNTAIAALMELLNEMRAAPALDEFALESFVILLAPLAPHEAEELWEMLGHESSIFDARWPAYDAALTVEDTVEIAIQVLGKLRGTITVARDADEAQVKEAALAEESVQRHIGEKTIVKVIHVPNRLMNFVVRG